MDALRFTCGLQAVLPGTSAVMGVRGEQCVVCEPCKGIICKVLRVRVDSTFGDVVQLVRTLPFCCTLSRALHSFLFDKQKRRTFTTLRSPDFESSAPASSASPAWKLRS